MTKKVEPKDTLQACFNLFLNKPSPENGWRLTKAMTHYAFQYKTKGCPPKNYNSQLAPKLLKTKNFPDKDFLFYEIQELFQKLGWGIISQSCTVHLETWIILAKDGNTGLLIPDTKGFSMKSPWYNEQLQGELEGLDDKEQFINFLINNGIELID